MLKLDDSDRSEMLPSGVQAVYKNRAGWAHDRLKRAGLSASLRRGYWQLTPAGFEFTRNLSGSPLRDEQLYALGFGNLGVKLRADADNSSVEEVVALIKASPDERLESALQEIRQSISTELREILGQVSPQFFESVVLDLLHKMGYGISRDDLQRVGGTGDGGIDGVISLDRLGLEKVYVQAKRWQANIGRPEVQAFYGALAGQGARKGVFITTSSYTQQAIDYASSVDGIVLVNGTRLAELMIDHEVGVASKTLRLPKIDSDYFE